MSLNIYVLLINWQVGTHEEGQILGALIQKLDFFFSSPFSYSMVCQPGLFVYTCKEIHDGFKDVTPYRNIEVIQETSNKEN